MSEKRVVVALGHQALGTDFPGQFKAVHSSVKVLADLIEEGCQLIITHSNAPQVGMIHTALNEYAKNHETYNAPMSICSSMSQGFIGYDIQNMLRTELIALRPFCWDTKFTLASIFGSIPFSSNSPSSMYLRASAAEICPRACC